MATWNSVDPDQMLWYAAYVAKACLPQYLGLLPYVAKFW